MRDIIKLLTFFKIKKQGQRGDEGEISFSNLVQWSLPAFQFYLPISQYSCDQIEKRYNPKFFKLWKIITCMEGAQHLEMWGSVGGCLQRLIHFSMLDARLPLHVCLVPSESLLGSASVRWAENHISCLVESCSIGQNGSWSLSPQKALIEYYTCGALIAFSRNKHSVGFSFIVFVNQFCVHMNCTLWFVKQMKSPAFEKLDCFFSTISLKGYEWKHY